MQKSGVSMANLKLVDLRIAVESHTCLCLAEPLRQPLLWSSLSCYSRSMDFAFNWFQENFWYLRMSSVATTSWFLSCKFRLKCDSPIGSLWISYKSVLSSLFNTPIFFPSSRSPFVDQKNCPNLSWCISKSRYLSYVSLSKEAVML